MTRRKSFRRLTTKSLALLLALSLVNTNIAFAAGSAGDSAETSGYEEVTDLEGTTLEEDDALTGFSALEDDTDEEGEAFFFDLRYYKGKFVNGNLTGDNAFFRYPNGDEFKGTFKDNAFYKGTYTVKEDGSYFTGTFKNGQPDKGIWYDKNGRKLE